VVVVVTHNVNKKTSKMSIRDEDRKGMDMTGVVDYGAKLDLYEWTQTRNEVTCTSKRTQLVVVVCEIDFFFSYSYLYFSFVFLYFVFSSKGELAGRRVGLCCASVESAKSRNSHDID
jgi:hypothetical protein